MLKVFLLDVDALRGERMFSDALDRVPRERRERVLALKAPGAQRLCLGAGLLLGHWLHTLGVPYQTARVVYGAQGKPSFPDAAGLDANLSHSGHYAALAASRGQVGVDIQMTRPLQPRVARRFFTPDEWRALETAPAPEAKNDLFCRLWTLKESYVKATGLGLSMPLNCFTVTLGVEGAALCPPGAYRLYELDAPPGYRLSACTTDHDERRALTQLAVSDCL